MYWIESKLTQQMGIMRMLTRQVRTDTAMAGKVLSRRRNRAFDDWIRNGIDYRRATQSLELVACPWRISPTRYSPKSHGFAAASGNMGHRCTNCLVFLHLCCKTDADRGTQIPQVARRREEKRHPGYGDCPGSGTWM